MIGRVFYGGLALAAGLALGGVLAHWLLYFLGVT